MPIRLRLALLFAVGAAVAAAVGGVLFVTELGGSLRSSLLTSLEVRADAISQQFPDSEGNGYAGLQVQEPGARPPPGSLDTDELTQILDTNGHLIDASGPGSSSPLITRAELAVLRRHAVVSERAIAGQPHRFLVLATSTGGNSSVVITGASLATVDQAVRRGTLEIVVGSIIGVFVAAVSAWLLAGAALRPVERMRRQAADISEHDADMALAVPTSRDEIASLARTLNDLLNRLHRALSRQRGFVSAAGHELRSPLAILKGELELARRPGRSQAELAEAVSQAAAETDRVIQLADQLLLLSRSDEQALALKIEPADLRSLVEASVTLFGSRAADARVRIEVDGPASLVAEVDSRRYRQIIDNLLDNALRYAPPESSIHIGLQSAGAMVMLEVRDHGQGFPVDFLPRAFDRFSRPDESRNRDGGGTGLGLAIVQSLAQAHTGTATVANGTAGGAVVRVTVPRARFGPVEISPFDPSTPPVWEPNNADRH